MGCAQLALLLLLSTVTTAGEIQDFERLIAAAKYAEVEPQLEHFTASHPQSGEAWYQLGFVYFRQHKIWPSVKALSKSLSIDPSRAAAHKILGHDFTILGRLDLAIDEFRRAIALDPKSAESQYGLGRAHYENGDYKQAAEHLEQTIQLDPGYLKAWHNLGLALEALSETDRAREYFVKAIELQRTAAAKSEWPYLDFAGFENRQGNPQNAIDLLRQAEAINAQSDQVYFELAKAHRALEQWQPAIKAIERAIQLNPRAADYHYILSLLCRKTGRLEQSRTALLEFERLKKAEP
jgi:tetratricopeptide (TPR) repeat protein